MAMLGFGPLLFSILISVFTERAAAGNFLTAGNNGGIPCPFQSGAPPGCLSRDNAKLIRGIEGPKNPDGLFLRRCNDIPSLHFQNIITMKRKKIAILIASAGIIFGSIVFAADHMDSPAVKGKSVDITDLYVFEGQDPNNLVFVGNTQGLLAPSATVTAQFDPNTLIQFKIDNDGDNVEDLVMQAIYQTDADGTGKILLFGPARPSFTGTRTKIEEDQLVAEVKVTPYGASPIIGYGKDGIKIFAGPRDDPFFFDLDQFHRILGGTATSFNNPGTDTFAGTNVLSIVVEVPKWVLHAKNGKINVWLTTSEKETGGTHK
jgi:hypothetical protein